jgi:hypothetical protein
MFAITFHDDLEPKAPVKLLSAVLTLLQAVSYTLIVA